jgi:hypothetical protein
MTRPAFGYNVQKFSTVLPSQVYFELHNIAQEQSNAMFSIYVQIGTKKKMKTVRQLC